MTLDKKKLRWGLTIIGYSALIGGAVTFFSFIAEALVDALGKPIGLGLFVTFTSIIVVFVTADHRESH